MLLKRNWNTCLDSTYDLCVAHGELRLGLLYNLTFVVLLVGNEDLFDMSFISNGVDVKYKLVSLRQYRLVAQ